MVRVRSLDYAQRMSTRVRARELAEAAVQAAVTLDLPPRRKTPSEENQGGPPYSERLARAFAYAAEQHRLQVRKGTSIPYLTHLMSVAALVGEHGGDEDQMMAALLHDTVEDTGGAPVLALIRERFGERVARIVEGCTDDDGTQVGGGKRPWVQRKTAYLTHVAEAPLEVLRVSASDKLHNLRTIVADLRVEGPAVFDRFKAGRVGTLWYYRSLSSIFTEVAKDAASDDGFRRLAGALARTVEELEAALA
jgi:(p)ppGpp synthase/HD superfamily hydrolase